VHSHEEYLQVLSNLALGSAKVDEERNKVLFSWMHFVRVFDFLPVFYSLQEFVFALVVNG
jgi:hypothetical protein